MTSAWLLLAGGLFPGVSQQPAPPVGTRREGSSATTGMPPLEAGGVRLRGFFVGSYSYNSRIQMVPEFAGGAAALTDAGETNFRFDKFGLSAFKFFAPWLSASGAIEVETHRDRHSHGFSPGFGCPGTAPCVERFGAEEPATEVNADRFAITAIAPVGNGLAFSLGRFDLPFGIERHDEPLNLTATASELFQFGRPQKMTGFQASYTFSPQLEVSAWAVNRWESETTHTPFDDNNKGKSFGGRIGFAPFPRERLLSFGFGGFAGPEQTNTSPKRWMVDFDVTAAPSPRFFVAGEFVYGGEEDVSFRRRGAPFPQPAVANANVRWWGLYLLPHYDFNDWLALSLRYGAFGDRDGSRTGVRQVLQSVTIAPVIHLSRLMPEVGDTGAAYARTRHPIHWLDLKLEYRFNHSNQPVFSDLKPAIDIVSARQAGHQFQVQFVANF